MKNKFGFAAAAALSLMLAACGGGEANIVEADGNLITNETLADDSLGNDLSLDNGLAIDALGNSSGNVTE